MTERPILFSGAMVRAILDGRKTQTRRVVKLPWKVESEIGGRPFRIHRDQCGVDDCDFRHTDDPRDDETLDCGGYELDLEGRAARSLYGAPGDRLWVRETWGLPPSYDPKKHGDLKSMPRIGPVCFAADYTTPDGALRPAWDGGKWRPSIHMPRWASRLTLEVTWVRVERLQAISEEDAKAEGARHFPDLPVGPIGHYSPPRWSMEAPENTDQCLGSPRWAFANLWQKLNGAGSWDANPWVWVITFKRVTP